LKSEEQRRLRQFYRRRLPPKSIITQEFARQLTELSHAMGRQIGLLVNRKGEVSYVIVGDKRGLMLPALEGYRYSPSRLRGLRLIHSHLNGEGLSEEDLTDLALLRLDLILAVEVRQDGLPGLAHLAHLLPENPENRLWLLMPPCAPAEIKEDFLSFIQALEDEFAKTQRTRKIDTIDRAILVRVETSPRGSGDAEISIEELRELARSSGVEVFDSIIQYRPTCDPKFVLGKGKLSQLIMRAMQIGANLLIFDHELTPAQLRSIADFTEMKVIDRTQLILDIFAKRAQSREGKIQVELAQLKYRLPRLAKRDKALSRLAGGIGARGPGEQKLEIDRRRVRDRIHQLEREIEKIAQSRKQKKVSRIKKDLPIISIVGYTNAGKSTLLNTLTKSAVFTEDRLFATLDPKSARLRFPRDREAIITDTVGFIRNLPPDLFAAFRATLDELKDADVLLHLVDLSNPYFEEHIRAVEEILTELEIAEKPTLLVFNKIDRIEDKSLIKHLCLRFGAVAISALDPDSLNPLLVRLSTVVEELAFDGRGKEGYRESPEDTIKTETEEIWV